MLTSAIVVLIMIKYSELSDLAMEAAQNDGRLARRPLSNRSKEIQAHEILLLLITQIIEEYNAAIKVKT
jgi:histone-lysine N-methyltransferase SETD3